MPTVRISDQANELIRTEAKKNYRTFKAQLDFLLFIDSKVKEPTKIRPVVKRFVKPEKYEVAFYISENRYNVDIEKWFSHYEANGWKVGKNPMKDWQAAVRTWHKPITDIPKPHNQFSTPQDEVYTEARNIDMPTKEDNEAIKAGYERLKKEAEERRSQGPPTEEEKAKGRANLLRDVILGKNNGRR